MKISRCRDRLEVVVEWENERERPDQVGSNTSKEVVRQSSANGLHLIV